MRVVLVGTPEVRQRLRSQVTAAGWQIAGEFDSLASARRAARESDAVLSGEQAGRIHAPAHEQPSPESLTPRELDVLTLMADGLSNKAIAGRLGISDQTVKFHVASIRGKLGTRNRTGTVRVALAKGLIAV